MVLLKLSVGEPFIWLLGGQFGFGRQLHDWPNPKTSTILSTIQTRHPVLRRFDYTQLPFSI